MHSSIITRRNAFRINKDNERVTGRKARGLQTEEIGCKCQTFLSLSQVEKLTSNMFSLLYTNLKELSLKILCCHNDTT